jgi:cysteinyl-tRNA synthetase
MGEELGLWRKAPADFFSNFGREDRPAPEEIEKMIAARTAARAARAWAEADRLRDALLARGVILEDKVGATNWKFTR